MPITLTSIYIGLTYNYLKTYTMNLDCFTVYVLFSTKNNTYYTGFTSNLIKRFHDHNFNNKSGYTVKHRPWIVLYTEIYFSKKEAMSREKYLKSGVGRDFIKKNFIPNYAILIMADNLIVE